MLQATSADIIKAYNNINLVQTQLQVLRKDCDQVFDESIWKNATHMATIAETEIIAPRICQRMTKRSNIPAGSSKDYFKVAVIIPSIDHILSELEFRFSQIQVHAACGMYLIPKNLWAVCTVIIYSNSLSGHYLPHRLSIKNLMFGNRCGMMLLMMHQIHYRPL